ncbi:MAG: class II fructose-bisphosphate aldolase [Pseudomonadota bacterium]
MPLVPLAKVLSMARARRGYAVGLVCLGWDDAEVFVAAGDEAGIPVILSAGPGARAHIPIPVWGAMFRALGARAACPVVAHLDHGRTVEECQAAIDAGFTSVMIDGSALPLRDNIALTADVSRRARAGGVSVEAELGYVGYAHGRASRGTEPRDVAAFVSEVEIDALAVSVGNTHLQIEASGCIDWARVLAITPSTDLPLVLHGGSGVPVSDRIRLARDHGFAKINVGTELRQAYGSALRRVLLDDPDLFDRIAIARAVRPRFLTRVRAVLAQGWNGGDRGRSDPAG